MNLNRDYTLLVLHKLEHSFGYYDVKSGRCLESIGTQDYPHEICLDPNREKVYIAEMGVRGIESDGEGGHTIAVFNVQTRERIHTIDTNPYDRPHGVATCGNRLYVTSESTKHLLVYDLHEDVLVKAVHLDQECAHMVAIAPGGQMAYTANILSNSLTAVDTSSFRVVRHIDVPERPEGMVFSPDGTLVFCVCREAGTVAVVDPGDGKMVGRIETGTGPVRIVITPDGRKLAIPLFHSSAMQVVDVQNQKVIHTLPLGPHPAGTCLSPDGRFVFISCEDENMVYVISLESMDIVQEIGTGDGADAMVCLYASELQ